MAALPPSQVPASIAQARADALLGTGRWEEAIIAYRQLLSADPVRADAWFNLAFACRRCGRFREALAAYGEALRHGVESPEVAHLNRAVILSDHLRSDADAMAELQAALALRPGYGAALLNLGNLHEERGEREEAIDCYRRLQSPSQPPDLAGEALARLLRLQPPASTESPLLARVREAASDTALDGATRANLLFSLGHTCDALGDTGRAFTAFVEAKRHAHRGRRDYALERDMHRTRALIASSAMPVPGNAARCTTIPEPVFICGMFRSGSTLLEQVLASHPMVAAGGELDLLPRMVAGPLAPFPASLRTLDTRRCRQLADAYQAEMRARLSLDASETLRYATDKRPDNYLLVGLIKRLFPHAKILHTVRNPLDNALSIFMQHLNPVACDYASSLAAIGHHYGEYRRLIQHWRTLYPGDIHDFDYDAFVAAPETTLRPLLAFLGLPWDPACLAFHQLGNTVKTASYWQVRRPLYADASGRWRRYREHLSPLFDALRAQGVPFETQ